MEQFLKLPALVKLTNAEPFTAWFVVTGDATADEIRVVRSVLGAISSLPVVAFRAIGGLPLINFVVHFLAAVLFAIAQVLYRKRIELDLSSDEFFYTACSLPVILKNSCGKLHCPRGLNSIIFSFKMQKKTRTHLARRDMAHISARTFPN